MIKSTISDNSNLFQGKPGEPGGEGGPGDIGYAVSEIYFNTMEIYVWRNVKEPFLNSMLISI